MQEDKKKIMRILYKLMKDRSTAYSEQRAEEATEALLRLGEGTYGVCVGCGRKIPEARLSAKPEAIRCLECQSVQEGQSVRSPTNV
jgi:phage/conjugal plasmid C-4 type zinc finger TraR family protein